MDKTFQEEIADLHDESMRLMQVRKAEDEDRIMRSKIGVNPGPHNIKVRNYWHFTECLVAMYPDDFKDIACTCMDWSPE